MEILLRKVDGVFIGGDEASRDLVADIGNDALINAIISFPDIRTLKQNGCMWLYLSILARKLNDSGWDMRHFFQEAVNIPWSKNTIKEKVWNDFQISVTGKKTSTLLTTVQMSDVHKIMQREISEKTGVYVSWPNRHGD